MTGSSSPEPLGKRPLPMTILCIIMFFGVAASAVVIWFVLKDVLLLLRIVLTFPLIIGLTIWIGLWRMKKWAAYIAIVMFCLGALSSLATMFSGKNDYLFSIPFFVLAVILAVFLSKQLRLMS